MDENVIENNISDARLLANRLNAQNSTGPVTPEGKASSARNATRHGLLAKKLNLPADELDAYKQHCDDYILSLTPVGAAETELAETCADLNYRLKLASALQHAILSDWASALENPQRLTTYSTYEQRLTRALNQNLKQLREIQADRRALESEQLKMMEAIAESFPPKDAENMDPDGLGFVCSKQQWLNRWYTLTLAREKDHPQLEAAERWNYYQAMIDKTLLRGQPPLVPNA